MMSHFVWRAIVDAIATKVRQNNSLFISDFASENKHFQEFLADPSHHLAA